MKVDFTGGGRDPTVQHNMKIPYGETKRKRHTVRWVLVLLLLLSPVIYLAGKIIYEQAVPVSYGVVSIEKIVVNTALPGQIQQINYRAGDVIHVNDPLMLLKNDPVAGIDSAVADRVYKRKSPCNGKVQQILVTEGEHYAGTAPLMILDNEDKAYLIAYVKPKYIRYAQPGAEAVVRISSTGRKALCHVVGNMAAVSEISTVEERQVISTSNVGASVLLEMDAGFLPEELIDQLPVQIFWR